MNINSLPFGLRPEQVPELVITFRVASTKMMSGFDEIVVRGTGEILLRTAVMANDSPTELPGRVEPLLVMRFLHLLQAEGMENWDDVYPAETHDFVAKVMTVAVNDAVQKEVAMCRTEFPEFSQAYGALKLLVSVSRPEVLTGAFFQRI